MLGGLALPETIRLFPDSYAGSRSRFRAGVEMVRRRWPAARLESHALSSAPELSIDWIAAEARQRSRRLICLTTGQHGLEGYVGSAVLQLFMEEYLGRLEPADTGLLLVHILNPWGMQHGWRTNAHNVDLNRNFVWDAGEFERDDNPDYARLDAWLNPRRPLGHLGVENTRFALGSLLRVLRWGARRVQVAALLGQRRFPQGIYYGGSMVEEEPAMMMELYRRWFGAYEQIVMLDIHSGYGPALQMSVVLSPLQPASSEALARKCGYPCMIKTTSSAFYPIQGDMIDWVHRLAQAEFSDKALFAAAFEFGTLGDSLLAGYDSLRRTVQGNQLRQHGASDERTRRRVWEEYRGLFVRDDQLWRAKCLADARAAFDGIFRAEGLCA